jgi:hypothetical protein
MLIVALLMIGLPVMFGVWMMWPASVPSGLVSPDQVSNVPIPGQGTPTTVAPPVQGQSQAVPITDPSLSKFPYAPGWPLALPGQIIGTPVVADLEGNGKLDIVVPCLYRNSAITMAHPHPDPTPLLFAFRADGTPLPSWPVVLGNKRRVFNGRTWGGWSSSPSVFRRNGEDSLVLLAPGRGVCVVNADRTMMSFPGGDNAVNVPLSDLDNNGEMDITIGGVAKTVDGGEIPTWPAVRKFRNGYAPCIGDALGDGHLKLFHLFYTNAGTPFADVIGFDTNGDRLPGWPQKIDDPSWLAPVMGDVTGDGRMDVIASYGQHIFAWTWDGKPLPHTTTQGPMTGILKSGVFAATACPALADLDGSGKADIIVFDAESQSIRAWHGDGTGVGEEHKVAPTTQDMVRSLVASFSGRPVVDGVIAKVPGDFHGVSVVSLGDDPKVMDFFTGTYWVRRFPDSRTTATNMLPADAEIEWTQPTIADVEGTGLADAIFGLSDGRVFVYRTNLAYHAERMQWPTANGNFQHTGAWKYQAVKSDGGQVPTAGPLGPGLQFRLVAEAGDTSDADLMFDPSDHQPVRVLKAVELDERDLHHAYSEDLPHAPPEPPSGRIGLSIRFSEAGAKKLGDLTGANIHRRLAIVFNESLLSAPTIAMRISGIDMSLGGLGLSNQQIDALVGEINGRINPERNR